MKTPKRRYRIKTGVARRLRPTRKPNAIKGIFASTNQEISRKRRSARPKEPNPQGDDGAFAVSGLDRYILAISKAGELLTREEEVALAKKMEEELSLEQKSGKQGDRAAFKEFVLRNLRLVVYIAKYYQGRGLSLEDLCQEGAIGLMSAAERFNWRLGYKFVSYASWWIWQAILRAIQKHGRCVRVPNHVADKISLLTKLSASLYQEFQREPTLEEVAGKFGITMEKMSEILRVVASPVALDELVSGTDDSVSYDLIPDRRILRPDQLACAREELRMLVQEMRELSEAVDGLTTVVSRYKLAFKLYLGLADTGGRFLEGATLEQLAKSGFFNKLDGTPITRERVRQMKARVWRKLYHRHLLINSQNFDERVRRIRELEDLTGEQVLPGFRIE